MEGISAQPEVGERETYSPKYIIFLGRHAEPAGGSIYDQVGGEAGFRSDNFEESSLTLKGLMDSSLLNYDLLGEITKRIPRGRIRLIIGNTRAYRTAETAELLKEKIENEAKSVGREIEISIEGPAKDDRLIEERSEEADKSTKDIRSIINTVSKQTTPEEAIAYFGVTHDAKLSNFLRESGILADGVNTSEFLVIQDEGEGKSLVSFRDQEAEISTEEEA